MTLSGFKFLVENGEWDGNGPVLWVSFGLQAGVQRSTSVSVCVCVDNLSARTLGILHILPCGVCVLESLLIIYSQAVKSKLPSASLRIQITQREALNLDP